MSTSVHETSDGPRVGAQDPSEPPVSQEETVIEFTEGVVDRPVRRIALQRADAVICTRAMLRGAITAVQRIDMQVCDAALLHAGTDLPHASDHLNAALFLAQQLVTLLGQARTALDTETALTPAVVA